MDFTISELQDAAIEQEKLITFLEHFEQIIIDDEKELTTEGLHAALDRVNMALSKPFLSPAEKTSIAKILAALSIIKKNKETKQGPKLSELLDRPGSQFARDLEDVAPGAMGSSGVKAFMQKLINDMDQNKTNTQDLVNDLRSLGPHKDDPWEGRE